jgi:hypothetical protein
MWYMHMGEMKIVYKILVGKPKGKRHLERPKYIQVCAHNIKMDFKESR